MNTSLDLSGRRTISIQCAPLWLHAAHTQPSSRSDIVSIHNIWESMRWEAVSCFSSRTADLCISPHSLSHTHTSGGKSSSNESKPVSLCWVCVYCSQVHWVGKWASNTKKRKGSLQKSPAALMAWSGEQLNSCWTRSREKISLCLLFKRDGVLKSPSIQSQSLI